MRKTAFAGLFACACVFAYTPSVNAEAFSLLQKDNEFQSTVTAPVLDLVEPMELAQVSEEQSEVKKVTPKVKKHKVVEGESLDKIARLYDTSWKRLYNKNTDINDPDMIDVGQSITIPSKDEKLKKRTLPEVQPGEVSAAEQTTVSAANTTQQGVAAATTAAPEPTPAATSAPKAQNFVAPSSSGNTYTAGQCTWHVKNLRGSSLPNGLGNANEWYGRAQAMGLATGTQPRVGAAGVRKTGNHAVYVTAVHGNGTITVSEMNYNWTPYATRSAVKPASDFYYIYK